MIKVVIFDMDGVIVDSEPWQYEAYREVFAGYGATIEKSEFIDLWVGRGSSLGEHIRRHGLEVPVEEVRQAKREAYARLIREEMQLRPGILGLLSRLNREITTALASSAHPDSVNDVLDHFELRDLFELVLTGADVVNNKPHPEMYETAARRLGVEPSECLVFEDSAPGVASAKAAGMRVIALPHEFTRKQDLSLADMVITDLRNLHLRLRTSRQLDMA